MNATDRVSGLIFDMDNTLLASRIDYSGMKAAVLAWLAERRLLEPAFDPAGHTTSTLIERVKASGNLTPEAETELWTLVASWEERGMRGAGAEPGIREAVAAAAGRFTLAVLTNNAHAAARTALRRTGMWPCFKRVYGRDLPIILLSKEEPSCSLSQPDSCCRCPFAPISASSTWRSSAQA